MVTVLYVHTTKYFKVGIHFTIYMISCGRSMILVESTKITQQIQSVVVFKKDTVRKPSYETQCMYL